MSDDLENLDIEKTVESLADDLGLTGTEPDTTPGSPTPPEGDEPAPPSEGLPPATPQGDEPPPAEPVVQARPAPKSWESGKKEIWEKLPSEAQDLIELREKQMLDGLSQYKQTAEFGNSIKELVMPYIPDWRSRGASSEAEALKYLIETDYTLTHGSEEQKLQTLATIAKNIGVDLNKVVQLAQNGPAPVDPTVARLERTVNEMSGAWRAREEQQVAQLRQKINNEVNTFAEAKDEKGVPLHPYFDDVANDIVLLLQDPRITLQDAYDRAVFANPVTRAKELARISKENEEKLRKEADAAARNARRRVGPNVRAVETQGSPTAPVGSIDETLNETFNKIANRT